MPADIIGNAKCPLCGGVSRVSLSKAGYPVMTMNCCNAQLFARSEKSDDLVRALILKKPIEPVPTQPATPAAQPVTTVRPPTPQNPEKPVRAFKFGF